ncbi:MAG: hypothetical protein ABEJ73_06285 [Haloplanus sp.]
MCERIVRCDDTDAHGERHHQNGEATDDHPPRDVRRGVSNLVDEGRRELQADERPDAERQRSVELRGLEGGHVEQQGEITALPQEIETREGGDAHRHPNADHTEHEYRHRRDRQTDSEHVDADSEEIEYEDPQRDGSDARRLHHCVCACSRLRCPDEAEDQPVCRPDPGGHQHRRPPAAVLIPTLGEVEHLPSSREDRRQLCIGKRDEQVDRQPEEQREQVRRASDPVSVEIPRERRRGDYQTDRCGGDPPPADAPGELRSIFRPFRSRHVPYHVEPWHKTRGKLFDHRVGSVPELILYVLYFKSSVLSGIKMCRAPLDGASVIGAL